ncbi:class I adenylate-forming enzyme family protein [Bdellovibrionota bacterium FG-2]
MIALICGKENVTFEELQNRVRTETVPHKGVQILTATPTLDFIVQFLACLETGRPAAIFSPQWSVAETQSRAALLQTPCHHETAVILFTSGSTGTPKAVQLSRKNIEANTRGVIASLDFISAREQTLFLPLSYCYGLLGQLLPALQCKIPTRILTKMTDIKGCFDGGSATGMWSGVPSHWEMILKITEPTHSGKSEITHIISAGAPLSLSLRERLRERFPRATIYNNYGQTEASPRILCFSSRDPAFFKRGVGYPIGDTQVRLGTDGELQVRGSQIMLGYLGDPETTAKKLEDGWLHTGDLAEISPETSNGSLVSITGRIDELFNVGGERTGPSEIEQVLKNIPDVTDAAVLIEDDQMYGSKISAFLIASVILEKNKVLAQISDNLSPNKIPREIYLIQALPRNASGKLMRTELKKLKTPARRLR